MYKIFIGLWVVVFFLLFVSLWAADQFGVVEIGKIIFHLHMPIKNAPTDWTNWLWLPISMTLEMALLGVILKKYIEKYSRYFFAFIIVILVVDITLIEKVFCISDYVKGQYYESDFIEKNYVSPNHVMIRFPNKKKNLILIQVESLETSVQDKENGGVFDTNYIPNLTNLAHKNISFSHSDLIDGAVVLPYTNWTVAGVVSQTAGIPLKIKNTEFWQIENQMDKYQEFLPGAVSLGDILYQNGYKNMFILGTAKEFAGQEDYLIRHGTYQIFDKEDINTGYESLPDKEVFDFAKNKIKETARGAYPFHVLIQTYDTHFGGYKAESCPVGIFKKNFQNGYACVDSLIEDFVKWVQKQDFYDNTMIAIVGDHCSMSKEVAREINRFDIMHKSSKQDEKTKRKVYNVFINASVQPIQKNNRLFSTMDIFPTLLAGIGVHIEGNRLGLGTNLFSNEKTLSEQFGYDYLFEELEKKSDFYNRELLYSK